jgi:chromosome partitioning protein
MGRHSLIWDLDMNRGASVQLGIPKEMPVLGSYEVLLGEEDPVEVVISTGDIEGLELPPNVSLIAARRNLENIDMVLNSKHVFGNPKDVLRSLVDQLRGDYDYIFLDTAPNLTIPTVAAYKAADYFLLSAIPEPLAIEGLSAALEDIATVKKQGNPSLRLIGVVLSAIKGRSTRRSAADWLCRGNNLTPPRIPRPEVIRPASRKRPTSVSVSSTANDVSALS